MDYNASERQHGGRGATPEIFALAAIALLAMAALTFGYNARTGSTEVAAPGGPGTPKSIQAQQPDGKNYVSPADKTAPPTSSSTGQGSSSGEQVAPKE
jgi:hypothetical protein